MPFDVDLSQVSPLFARLHSLFSPSVADDILLVAGRRVGVAAEGLVSPYPAASGKPLPLYYTRQRKDGTTYQSKFKTLAQQKKVFTLIQQGRIPYKRTGSLGKSIVSQAVSAGSGLVIVSIGSRLAYAPYVIDLFLQSHYHRGTWRPIQSDIERGLPELQRVGVKAVEQEVNRRLANG